MASGIRLGGLRLRSRLGRVEAMLGSLLDDLLNLSLDLLLSIDVGPRLLGGGWGRPFLE